MKSAKSGRRVRLVVLLLSCILPSFAHGDGLYFEKREFPSLAVPPITDIAEDERGYIWIGTQAGLIRYDGQHAVMLDRISLPELPADHVLALEFVAATGDLWIGTVAGVVRYDLRDEQVEQVPTARNVREEIGGDVFDFASTSDGVVFAATPEGILKTGRGDTLMNLAVQGSDAGSARDVHDLFVDPQDRLWVVAGTGLFTWDAEAEELVPVMKRSDFRCVTGDAESIWIGSADPAIYRYRPEDGRFDRFPSAPDTSTLSIGANGLIWAGSPNDGLALIDPRDGSVRRCDVDPEHPYKLPTTRIRALFQGSSGHQWVGTADAGVFTVDIQKQNHLEYIRRSGVRGLPSGPIRVLYEDGLGYLWAGSGITGMARIDPESGDIRRYQSDPGDPFAIASDHVSAMAEDSTGRLWVGTEEGPMVYIPEVDGFEPPGGMVGAWPDFRGRHVLAMAAGADGSVWMSFRDGELFRLNIFDRDYMQFRFTPASVPSFLTVDRFGSLWAGSRQNLRIFNADGNLVRTWLSVGVENGGIPEGGVTAILTDSRDRIWVGGPTGLVEYRGVDEGFVEVGPPGATAINVTDLAEDQSGRLWVSDGRRIHVFDAERTDSRTIGRDSGFTPSGFISSLEVSREGMIFAGASGEIWSLNDGIASVSDDGPVVYLTELRILDEHVANGRTLQDESSITLSSAENMFRVGFGAVSYRYKGSVGFQYRLEGFHDEWIDGGNTGSVTYAKLPPGRYRFVVRAYDDNGTLSRNEASLAIRVEPVFWLTPAAIAFYVLLTAGLVAVVVKLREGRLLKSQVRELEEARRKVVEANKALEFLTMSDSLTGLLNRRGFDEAISHALTTAHRNDLMITLFMLDVDFFKRYNDNYGHVRGDEVLRGVGKALRSVFERSTDIIARYGGEEFAVVFIGENPNASVTLANDLIVAVEELDIAHDYSPISDRLTLSAGSATLRARHDLTVDGLVARADRALYAAKSGGRNRVCYTGIIPELPPLMKNEFAPLVIEGEPPQ